MSWPKTWVEAVGDKRCGGCGATIPNGTMYMRIEMSRATSLKRCSICSVDFERAAVEQSATSAPAPAAMQAMGSIRGSVTLPSREPGSDDE